MIPITTDNATEAAKAVRAGELPGPAKSLAEAMARVMEQVGYVQKTGQMQGHARYSYARESDFIAAIRPEMVRQGITFCPTGMEMIVSENYEQKSGSRANRVVIQVKFTFTHAASGDRLEVTAFGEGIDSGDKACNKAMTAAMKYALRQSFVIETGDDPDDTPSEQQQRASMPAVPPAKDNPALRANYAQRIAQATDRAGLANLWRGYDADVKSGKLGPTDKIELDKLFQEGGKRFPAPTTK